MTKLLVFLKGQGMLFIALAILAATSILSVIGSPPIFSGTDAYGVLMVALGAVGVLAGGVLGSTQPNSNLLSHLIFVLAAVGMCLALGLNHVFTSSQILGVFEAFLGGGAAGVGVAVVTSPAPAAAPPPATLAEVAAVAQTSHQNG